MHAGGLLWMAKVLTFVVRPPPPTRLCCNALSGLELLSGPPQCAAGLKGTTRGGPLAARGR